MGYGSMPPVTLFERPAIKIERPAIQSERPEMKFKRPAINYERTERRFPCPASTNSIQRPAINFQCPLILNFSVQQLVELLVER
jgi:hypothetical protein